MKLFPDIELSRFYCQFENYTQPAQPLIMILAIIGLFSLTFWFYKFFRRPKS